MRIPAFPGDLALAYSRVSRAVRLTLMLQSKLIEELRGAEKAGAEARAAAEALLPLDPMNHVRARVDAIVQRVARTRHPDDEDAVDDILRESAERLDDEDLYGDLLERPLSELVARLCKDLGLDPDWAELAEELWAIREVADGQPGWPLARVATASTKAAERATLSAALAALEAPPAQPLPHEGEAVARAGWFGSDTG